MVSDTNNNSNNANNNGEASGKRRTQSLSALQNLQNSKEPQSPLNKVCKWNLFCCEWFVLLESVLIIIPIVGSRSHKTADERIYDI